MYMHQNNEILHWIASFILWKWDSAWNSLGWLGLIQGKNNNTNGFNCFRSSPKGNHKCSLHKVLLGGAAVWSASGFFCKQKALLPNTGILFKPSQWVGNPFLVLQLRFPFWYNNHFCFSTFFVSFLIQHLLNHDCYSVFSSRVSASFNQLFSFVQFSFITAYTQEGISACAPSSPQPM